MLEKPERDAAFQSQAKATKAVLTQSRIAAMWYDVCLEKGGTGLNALEWYETGEMI